MLDRFAAAQLEPCRKAIGREAGRFELLRVAAAHGGVGLPQDERFARELVRVDGAALGPRVRGRGDHHQLVLEAALGKPAAQLPGRRRRLDHGQIQGARAQPGPEAFPFQDVKAALEGRVTLGERAQDARQQVDAGGGFGAKQQRALGDAAKRVEGIAHPPGLAEQVLGVRHQGFACRGEREPPPAPREERKPQVLFQLVNLLADRRLGEAQAPRGLGVVEGLGGDDEGAQPVQVQRAGG
ncbi:hypothetical protein D3C86_1091300 [compost metagenome]